MAITVRNTAWGGSSSNASELLTAYVNEEIKVLEPQLQYAKLGVQRNAPKGFDRILFPQTNQLPVKINISGPNPAANGSALGASSGGSVFGAGASVIGDVNLPVSSSFGVAAITEGTNPSAVTWGASSYSSGPFQYGILVQVSDLLVHNSAIEVIDSCSMQVRNALARLVDTIIQTVVNAGVNGVLYAGGKTSRSTLGAGDILTQFDMNRAYRNLAASNAAGLKPFDGKYYAAVVHPFAEVDLMTNSATGAFVDVGRYTSVDDLRAGAMGDYRGIRYMRSAWQNYFNSTVNVFPTTVVGEQSFGWGFFQEPQAILTTTPDSGNALNLFSSIGGKTTLGATRFEDSTGVQRIIRVESAVSA